MKIVHISTYDTGGAGTAALRLHKGLLQQNIDSTFLCLHNNNNRQPGIVQYAEPYIKKSFTEKVKKRLGYYRLTQAEKNAESIKHLNGEYEKSFSFPLTDYTVENDSLLKNADIIHLHWVADFINYPSFFSTIKKPVAWTLHDMNPFMGGFHYTADNNRNAVAYKKINDQAIRIKSGAVALCKQLAIVSPSKWLLKRAEESKMFTNASFQQIYYGLDCTVFKSHDKDFARRVFNLPADKKILLFVSESINNYRKGFDIVLDAIRNLNHREDFIILTVGAVFSALPRIDNIINLGTVQDERLMSLAYAAADLFILPSREDNLPNVMLESFACGTPVLSFKTGGMAEEITPGFNGFFMCDVTAEAFIEAINNFLDNKYKFEPQEIREAATKKFALEIQADCYKDLYESML